MQNSGSIITERRVHAGSAEQKVDLCLCHPERDTLQRHQLTAAERREELLEHGLARRSFELLAALVCLLAPLPLQAPRCLLERRQAVGFACRLEVRLCGL